MSQDLYEKAKERVKNKKEFRKEFSSFLQWTAILLLINVFVTRGYFWSFWVIGFWGIAILKKAYDVYGSPFDNPDWEKKEIEKEMKRLKNLDQKSQSDFPDKKPKSKEAPSESPNQWDEDEFV
jgi:hypothetical protein